jgi:hypothetical protein
MNEPYPGGPGGGYPPRPGGRRQPDHWPNDDDRADRYRRGGRRRPELELTTVDQLIAVDRPVADQTAVLDSRERPAGRSRPSINVNWALIGRNWALIAGLVFFLIDTFLMADGFARPVALASRVLVTFIWLVSMAAVGVLWLRGSSKFSIQNPFVRAETGTHRR